MAIVRSLTMRGKVIGDGDHHADTYYMLTGHQPDRSFFVEGINRKPHADEKDAALKHLKAAKTRAEAVTDLVWALVNTREFILNH